MKRRSASDKPVLRIDKGTRGNQENVATFQRSSKTQQASIHWRGYRIRKNVRILVDTFYEYNIYTVRNVLESH